MGCLILVVDDEPELRRLLGRLLREEGYRVLEAAGAAQALEHAAGCLDELGLLLTDVYMPGMNGCALARRLSQMRPGLPVIFVSGYSDVAVDPDAVLLRKPFHPDALRRAVARAVSGRADRRVA